MRDETCPISTRGGTRLVRLVRGRGGGGEEVRPLGLIAAGERRSVEPRRAEATARRAQHNAPPPRGRAGELGIVKSTAGLVRGEGPGVSGQYGVRDAACPISTG